MAFNAFRCAPGSPPAERQLTRFHLAALAAILFLAAPAAFAGSASATMNVSVSVIARAVLTVTGEPSSVNVTAADVARGYVDVASPISLLVRTNSRSGYLLQVDRDSSAFPRIDLTFGDAQLSVGPQAWISRPYVPGGESLVMKARVFLGSAVEPGAYPLALVFSANPL